MLIHRLRRWSNIKSKLIRFLVFAGDGLDGVQRVNWGEGVLRVNIGFPSFYREPGKYI